MCVILSLLLVLVASLIYCYWERVKEELSSMLSLIVIKISRDPSASILANMLIALASKTTPTTVRMHGKCKVIAFADSQGVEHFVPLPFDRRKKSIMFRMDDKVDRHYPKGVEFYCTPNQLGSEYIEIEDEDGIRKYSGDELPH